MRQYGLVAVIAAVALSGCAQLESDPKASAEIDTLKSQVAATADAQRASIADLERRVEQLEAGNAKGPESASAPANLSAEGSWILWSSEMAAANPRGILASAPRPKPLYAYSSQADCTAAADRVAVGQNGQPGTSMYLRAGAFDIVWAVTLACLPKGVDPR